MPQPQRARPGLLLRSLTAHVLLHVNGCLLPPRAQYGTIDFEAVNAELTVERAPSGAFLRIEGLPASTAS
jgi:hypothetical protein